MSEQPPRFSFGQPVVDSADSPMEFIIGVACEPNPNPDNPDIRFSPVESKTLIDEYADYRDNTKQFLGIVREHFDKQVVGRYLMPFLTKNNDLGVIGVVDGTTPVGRSVITDLQSDSRIGLSLKNLAALHPTERRLTDHGIIHLGIVEKPCWKDTTWVYDTSPDFNRIMQTFVTKWIEPGNVSYLAPSDAKRIDNWWGEHKWLKYEPAEVKNFERFANLFHTAAERNPATFKSQAEQRSIFTQGQSETTPRRWLPMSETTAKQAAPVQGGNKETTTPAAVENPAANSPPPAATDNKKPAAKDKVKEANKKKTATAAADEDMDVDTPEESTPAPASNGKKRQAEEMDVDDVPPAKRPKITTEQLKDLGLTTIDQYGRMVQISAMAEAYPELKNVAPTELVTSYRELRQIKADKQKDAEDQAKREKKEELDKINAELDKLQQPELAKTLSPDEKSWVELIREKPDEITKSGVMKLINLISTASARADAMNAKQANLAITNELQRRDALLRQRTDSAVAQMRQDIANASKSFGSSGLRGSTGVSPFVSPSAGFSQNSGAASAQPPASKPPQQQQPPVGASQRQSSNPYGQQQQQQQQQQYAPYNSGILPGYAGMNALTLFSTASEDVFGEQDVETMAEDVREKSVQEYIARRDAAVKSGMTEKQEKELQFLGQLHAALHGPENRGSLPYLRAVVMEPERESASFESMQNKCMTERLQSAIHQNRDYYFYNGAQIDAGPRPYKALSNDEGEFEAYVDLTQPYQSSVPMFAY